MSYTVSRSIAAQRSMPVLALGALSLVMLVGTLPAQAQSSTVRYVRDGATGSGSGSDWDNACDDFTGSCAAASLVRGATYYVADGAYAARTWSTASSGTSTITIKKAIPSDHGADLGWNGTYGDGQAVFTGANVVNTNYWVFDGQVGDYRSGVQSYGFKFDFNEGQMAVTNLGNFNTFRYIDFDGVSTTGNRNYTADTKGLAAYGGSNWTLSHCAIHGGESLIQGGGDNWVVEYSYLYNARSTASNYHNNVFYASGMNGGVFRYNRVWDYNDEGLFFTGYNGPVANIIVYGNVFYSDGTPVNPRGIELRQDYGYSGMQFYNNTFARLGVGGILNRAPETGHSCTNCVAHNNVSYEAGNTLTGMTASNNTDDSTNRFVNLSTGDLRLAGALAGMSLGLPYNVDVLGAARGGDGVFDRGAYEFTSTAGSTPPATPQNLRVVVP
jgi:hypothetical protein